MEKRAVALTARSAKNVNAKIGSITSAVEDINMAIFSSGEEESLEVRCHASSMASGCSASNRNRTAARELV